MPIPDFQSIMLPLLKFTSDKKEHSTSEALEDLANEFKLSDIERGQMLPSGNQKIFYNRVYWAKAYLKMSGLIENTKRAHFKISERGIKTLNENPTYINVKYLKKFPDFSELSESWKKTVSSESTQEDISNIKQTPEEIIENNYQRINKNLAQELISKIKSVVHYSLKTWL